MNKLRFFAMPETLTAAEGVLTRIVETYDAPGRDELISKGKEG
ncbi:hypothetical protein ACDY96_08480 [Rhizobium mongolense]